MKFFWDALCAYCFRRMPTCDDWPEYGLLFCNGSRIMCDVCWLRTIELPWWKVAP